MPEAPESKEDLLWIPHKCEVCHTTTSHLDGCEPHCVKCAMDKAVEKHDAGTVDGKWEEIYPDHTDDPAFKGYMEPCLLDTINSTDPQTLAKVRSECADNGCNVCLADTSFDDIEWPKHYNSGKIQPIDAIESWDLDFRLANVVKYIARAGKKNPKEVKKDLEKARWYLNRYIDKECDNG